MEDIVLVTGCHLAGSFANIAFSDGHGEEQVSFEVQVPDVSRVEWRFPFEDVQGAALNVGPSGQVRVAFPSPQALRRLLLNAIGSGSMSA